VGQRWRGRRTCVVPVGFGKRYRGVATLDARAIDEDVDIATHRVKSTGEQTANLVHVLQIAVQDSCRNTACGNPIISLCVFDTLGRRTLDKTDICAGLCEGEGARSTDATGSAGDEHVAAAEVEERRGWHGWRRIHSTENESSSSKYYQTIRVGPSARRSRGQIGRSRCTSRSRGARLAIPVTRDSMTEIEIRDAGGVSVRVSFDNYHAI
jgi:hypothetical protein